MTANRDEEIIVLVEDAFANDDIVGDDGHSRPGLLTNLIIILLILAMLATIAWPLFVYGLPSQPTPTPRPAFLQET